jgi:hypothetical protein
MRKIMTRKQRSFLLIASAVFGLSTAAWAETVYVKLQNATIRTGKNATLKPVAEVNQGDKLQVIAREGSWLKVSIGGKEGYIHQNSISADAGGGAGGTLGRKFEGGTSSEAGAGLAGRGLGDSAKWAQGKGLSTAGLDRMVDQKKQFTKNSGDELEMFVKDGHVGPAKK